MEITPWLLTLLKRQDLSASTKLGMQAMSFSAWNGLGLALVIPCVQSLIADSYSASSRGRAFGLLFFTSSLGKRLTACHQNSLNHRTLCILGVV